MPVEPPRLLLITPPQPDPSRLSQLLPGLARCADAVLLRWPALSDADRYALCARLAEVAPRPRLLVSDRVDIALAAHLDGVHLRDDGLPPNRARALAPGLLIGVSRHASSWGKDPRGADYLTLSPVFSTPSKPDALALGLQRFSVLVAAAALPVLALGGVDAASAPALLGAGATGVASSSWVWSAPDPLERARRLRAALGPFDSS